MANILCGPVVGRVTANTAYVLFEVDKTGLTQVNLKEIDGDLVRKNLKYMREKVPLVFGFIDLKEDTQYDIMMPAITEDRVLGRVHTLPTDVTLVGIAAVSCDRPLKDERNMWEDLYTKATKGSIHVILHMGDNVYLDESEGPDGDESDDVDGPYHTARQLLRNLERKEWDTMVPRILDMFRDRYKEMWTMKPKARVLANFSNFMVLDEHEIRHNFGKRDADSDPDSVDFFLGTIAIQVYHEYQRQLWEPDVFKQHDKHHELVSIEIGPMRITMTDPCTSRSLYRRKRKPDDNSYMGREQHGDLLRCLSPDDNNIRMNIVVCQLPLLFVKRKVNQIGDMNGRASELTSLINQTHVSESEPILDAISALKKKRGPAGDVVMFGGGTHLGGFLDICKSSPDGEQLICHHVTASAIRNFHWLMHDNPRVRKLLSFTEGHGDYRYTHYGWVNTCNFAMLHANFSDPDLLNYTVQLVHEHGTVVKKSSQSKWRSGGLAQMCQIL